MPAREAGEVRKRRGEARRSHLPCLSHFCSTVTPALFCRRVLVQRCERKKEEEKAWMVIFGTRRQPVAVIAIVIMPANIRLCESPDPASESLFLPVARKSTNSTARLERHQIFLRKCDATAVQELLLPLLSTRKRHSFCRPVFTYAHVGAA